MPEVGLIHTVSRLAPTFADLADELLPSVGTTVIVDELLLKATVRDGSVGQDTAERLRRHVYALGDYGVDAVLVTCSSVGEVVGRDRCGVGHTRVPGGTAPMAERAVVTGATVGVLATLSTTLRPTTDLVTQSARAAGRDVEVISRLCDGAFDALQAGDMQAHDAIVAEELDRLVSEADVVVLAQASMARIAAVRASVATPVLSSPRSSVERLAELPGLLVRR